MEQLNDLKQPEFYVTKVHGALMCSKPSRTKFLPGSHVPQEFIDAIAPDELEYFLRHGNLVIKEANEAIDLGEPASANPTPIGAADFMPEATVLPATQARTPRLPLQLPSPQLVGGAT